MDIRFLLPIVLILALIAVLAVDKFRMAFRRACRFIFYDNSLVAFLRNKFMQVFVPGIAGLYFLCLDVWGDHWLAIKNYREQHEFLFAALIILSLVILIIRGSADWYEGKSDKAYIAFMEQFSVLTSKLVTKKLERFKDEALRLKPNGNTFKQITKPKDQINMILGEIETLLFNNFEVNRGWKHTKAQKLIDSDSAASECLRTGQPVFHACKKQASKSRKYFLSDRDKSNGVGSVFCYPALTTNPDYTDNYIVSIVTYGKRLCDPLDQEQAEAISDIFSDICQRLDLELTLHSIKKWQFEYHTNRTRGAP